MFSYILENVSKNILRYLVRHKKNKNKKLSQTQQSTTIFYGHHKSIKKPNSGDHKPTKSTTNQQKT